MIVDSHGHLLTSPAVFGVRAVLQASNGQHSKDWYVDRYIRDDDVDANADRTVAIMDQVGTDLQLLSPRPFMLMHSHPVAKDVQIWVGLQNDLIRRTVARHPSRFRGVAGLPQVAGEPVEIVFDELDRCITELGFVGVLLNPDPAEGGRTSPRLSDPYWYPLWEKLVELNVPAHIHSAGCAGRETYDEHFSSEESLAVTSLVHSDVFKRYPSLKVMISHGGGSIPYQIGRWRSHWFTEQAVANKHIAEYFQALERAGFAGKALPEPPDDLTTFDEALRQLYFDADVHDPRALRLLLETVGPDRCLFGTERPGSGGAIDLATGRPMDDFKFVIDRFDFLTDGDREQIYVENARAVFPRLGI